jgi:hypothetical protein
MSPAAPRIVYLMKPSSSASKLLMVDWTYDHKFTLGESADVDHSQYLLVNKHLSDAFHQPTHQIFFAIRQFSDLPVLFDRHPIQDEDAQTKHHRAGLNYSGMFPCFLGGLESRLFSKESKASIIRRRVSRGSSTSSTYPSSAALYGVANLFL